MVQVRFGASQASYFYDFELESAEQAVLDDVVAIRDGRFAHASALRRILTHVQLSGKLANLVYSMDVTNTDFYAHQYKPVLSFLESPSNGILIADEVGLGKTIEAGLIWTELRARVDARRLLVVCPKMLCSKWRDELGNRFGVTASIVGASELLEELKKPRSTAPDGRALIASMQGLRPPKGWDDDQAPRSDRARLAQRLSESAEDEPLIDLLVIDEAHYLRNPETSTHQLGGLLRSVAEHVALLSATPINLRNEDLFSLLNIVDPDSFRFREQFARVLEANEPLVRARQLALSRTAGIDEIRRELQRTQRFPLIAQSKQLEVISRELDSCDDEFTLDDAWRVRIADRIERVNLLGRAITRTRKAEVQESRVVRDARWQRVPMSMAEKHLYEQLTETIRAFAIANEVPDGFLLATPQRQLSSCMYAAAATWARRGNGALMEDDEEELLYEDLGIEVDDGSQSSFMSAVVSGVRPHVNLAELRRNDSKFNAFLAVLKKYFGDHSEEKVIVFSFFRGTLAYLSERLAEAGIESIVLTGSTKENKSVVIERFRESAEVRVLLSSEVAAEGVDLQFSRFLVNYDLPWNPMKVEQRIGRIDRLGQRAEKIFVWSLVYDETIDSRILARLYERLELFTRALGSMEAVVGDEIRKLTHSLLTGALTPEEQEERIAQSALALENRKISEEQLESQAAHLIAHGGYILQKVRAAHEFSRRVTEDDLLLYVRDYLNRYAPGHEFRQPDADSKEVDIRLPARVAARFDDFLRSRRQIGLSRLASGDQVRCRFVNKVDRPTPKYESISQFHPLLRFIGKEIVEDTSQDPALVCLRLSIGVKMQRAIAPGTYGFVVQRWVFDGFRVEELLQARVVDIKSLAVLAEDESLDLVNSARIGGKNWLEAANVLDADRAVAAMEEAEFALVSDFESERQVKEAENFDRVSFQRDAIRRHLERKLEIENRRIEALGTRSRSRGLVIAAQRRIATLQSRFETQDAQLQSREQSSSRREIVCKGVILMGDQ